MGSFHAETGVLLGTRSGPVTIRCRWAPGVAAVPASRPVTQATTATGLAVWLRAKKDEVFPEHDHSRMRYHRIGHHPEVAHHYGDGNQEEHDEASAEVRTVAQQAAAGAVPVLIQGSNVKGPRNRLLRGPLRCRGDWILTELPHVLWLYSSPTSHSELGVFLRVSVRRHRSWLSRGGFGRCDRRALQERRSSTAGAARRKRYSRGSSCGPCLLHQLVRPGHSRRRVVLPGLSVTLRSS
jgi:hypothetical protein